MDTSKLRKFASYARKSLIEQVGTRMKSVLADGSLARRENPKAVADLEVKIKELGRERTVEMVAYTWFNRFCALRYMDINRYTKIGIVSPAEGQFQPEILAEAKMGHVDDELVPMTTREKVLRLLDETDPSEDPQGEAYRLLLVAVCNYYHGLMPFMFEKIADFTELLLPDDLLSGNSILAYTREALLPINCSPEHTEESVEVIGWLYQFYIADKKDDVFAALKKGKKITPENIPAATQLFTPHWIVRYLVENSLGRLWMLNHPDSRLIEKMDYYIKPEEPETDNPKSKIANPKSEDFLRISSPEEIKICDPACGSGHMLTYAFDLLYAIYEEQGYQATDIPRLILTHNLYGIEIDQRAGALAAFALTMKARGKYRRFLTGGKVVEPNICVLENIDFEANQLDEVTAELSDGAWDETSFRHDLLAFKEAVNFGSLIRPKQSSEQITALNEHFSSRSPLAARHSKTLFQEHLGQKVLTALRQADYLSPKYHVVVANPPYMGSKGMNGTLRKFLRAHYEHARSDLMTCFMDAATHLSLGGGFWGMINLPSWLSISSFTEFRTRLVAEQRILNMLHLGRGIFGSDFGTVAFTIENEKPNQNCYGVYRRLFEEHVQVRTVEKIRQHFLDEEYGRFVANQGDFLELPGTPIAYWVSNDLRELFRSTKSFSDYGDTRRGLQTGDSGRFVKHWHEVEFKKIGFNHTKESAKNSGCKWYPFNSGGSFRKWFGNLEEVVNWGNDGAEIKATGKAIIPSEHLYFKKAMTWPKVTSGKCSFRVIDDGIIPGDAGPCFFADNHLLDTLAFANSKVARLCLGFLSPTLNFEVGVMAKMPLPITTELAAYTETAIALSRQDWNSTETAWDFQRFELLNSSSSDATLAQCYESIRGKWHSTTEQLRSLEENVNGTLIKCCHLEAELDSAVPLENVTLNVNPFFRYDEDKSESELESLLLADTMREFISYAVGCMLGRFSLDAPGLILANQGDSVEDYYRIVNEKRVASGEQREEEDYRPSFPPDDDNVIPLLDGDWFTDDISERFKEFLKITFGTEHYEENLTFLENALYPDNLTGKMRKTIRDYFLKEFYNHHIKLYKKRPIYWLFSSPKGTFNALIYMHRYRPDTVSTVLQYLRDFRDKLAHRRDHLQAVADSGSASQSDKTKALKEVATLKKQLKELEDYETDTLFPLAQKRREIDLDDGVKHNYPLFGKALKNVPGLS
ncbi:MAG: BREX-1 system adenine-specific DNA-methyltransferase PglX [bacterium]|nr:BREX-1 system adenine-specific DNA-methyltransferase PglX [bacterium]